MLVPKAQDSNATRADVKSTSSGTPPSSSPMSYADLLQHGCKLLAEQGMKQLQVRNLASALRGWVTTHGFVPERVVGEDFTTDFDRLFARYCHAISGRQAVRTQRDRQEQLLRWKHIAGLVRQRDTLPPTFAGALASALRASPLLSSAIAQRVGLDRRTLDQWSTGSRTPCKTPLDQLKTLESVLELPNGALVSRLPPARRARYERGSAKRAPNSFTLTRRAQRRRVGVFALQPTPKIVAQWQDLIAHKTNLTREHARARNTWRLKPLHRVGFVPNAMMMHSGQVCATAGVQWNHASCYLGWLALASPEGPGLARDTVDTMAHFANPDLFIRYVRWRIGYSGGKFHNGIKCLFQMVESLLRPLTGFLWLRPDLRQTVPELNLLDSTSEDCSEEARWQRHCEAVRAKLHSFRVSAADSMGIRLSRDPTERMTVVLNDPFPLKRLVAFVEKLETSGPPPAHQRTFCAWIRDVALCRMLISNPLRINHFVTMTFRADGSGNLVRVAQGRFRLKFSPSDFKNEKGAARDPYNVEVDTTAGNWIERYLTEARPYLVGAQETDRLFLPSSGGGGITRGAFLEELGLQRNPGWDSLGMSGRIKSLTGSYIENCPGFGPHAFRHIIATDHLRRHPGDYPTVATLLHDRLETVLQCYGHLRVDDGLRALASGIHEATRQLAGEREVR